jgi:tetratricopeptide (TPR) repeat protein
LVLAQGPLEVALDEALEGARRTYDLEAAERVRQAAAADRSVGVSELTLAKACLLVAELHRIKFENTTASDHMARRRSGELIDAAAREGLAALETLASTSETLRLEADLLATLIRSKFRGKKYRKPMERAAREALVLDAGNARALVSLAKPRLFAPGRDETDLEAGLGLLREALEVDPDLETALLLKGRALDELGRTAEAVVAWRRALEINPESRPAIDLLQDR